MRAIGFKNFRKFTDFPMMEFAPITIFVGCNNAGKSTLVKGLLTFEDFLKTMPYGEVLLPFETQLRKEVNLENVSNLKKKYLRNQKFYFNTNPYTHIGTFERALNNVANADTISFQGIVGNYTISVEVSKGQKNELSYGLVSKVRLCNNDLNISITFDLFSDSAKVEMLPFEGDLETLERESEKKFFECIKKPHTFSFTISDHWTAEAPTLLYSLMASFNHAITFSLISTMASEYEKTIIPETVGDYLFTKPVEGLSTDVIEALKRLGLKKISTVSIPSEAIWRHLRFEMPGSRILFSGGSYIEYIYSHAVSQNVWYVPGSTDYLSKTILEFTSEQNVEYKREFIEKWMDKDHFSIGKTYSIDTVGGEAFRVKIIDFDNSVTDLADKGMGTIQLMVLLFRLAINLPMKRYRRPNIFYLMKNRIPEYIIVEEPEQNLHPSIQSKLADLFYEMSLLGIKFIVETHSEYLIRNCQVLVGNLFKNELPKKFDHNPFKVFYFTGGENPYYDMEFTNVGGFKKKFGSGFFNEAGRLDSLVTNNKYDSL